MGGGEGARAVRGCHLCAGNAPRCTDVCLKLWAVSLVWWKRKYKFSSEWICKNQRYLFRDVSICWCLFLLRGCLWLWPYSCAPGLLAGLQPAVQHGVPALSVPSPALCLLPYFSPSLVFVLQCSHFLPSVPTTPEYSSCSSFSPLCAALRLCVCSCCAAPKVLMFPLVKLPTSGRVTAAGSPFLPSWIGVQVESLPTCTYLLLLP